MRGPTTALTLVTSRVVVMTMTKTLAPRASSQMMIVKAQETTNLEATILSRCHMLYHTPLYMAAH